ncbi:MAG: aromatic ring-hydroxylating dioxygenase subunit alpha [Deltaproteobacteria bacterium]|nr:aromatic ring-hydroxylating dioxygenase subunit alpha [Deltaproteobacteria bacterium]MCW5804507.1 aromatic ring-hydroxylating dioxygenase subunit alpha [Deltaproteobacteria bacterium]
MRPAIDGVELAVPAPGRNLPPRAFTSPAVFDAEQRAIFARSWVHVADLVDLPSPGSYVAAKIGRTPVLVLRDRKTGELRAFLNACRHRGAQLLDGKGTCDKQIKCPYHAWSYGHDGALVGVPYREEFDGDIAAMGLVPVRVGTVGPLVFACLDPAAPELAAWVGQLPAALELAGAASWALGYELAYELEANWKLFVENANDGYHIQFVHDLLTDLLAPDSGETTLEAHGAYTVARINPAYVPPERDPGEAKIRFGCIFPNLIPVLSPSDLTYIRVDPVAHDRLRLFVRSYDHPEFANLRELRKLAFERTADQDIAVVERTMRGLHAEGLPPGVHSSRLEERIGHIERLWADAMLREYGPTNKRLLAVAGA